MIVERVKELSSLGEIFAGDKKEDKMVNRIRKLFDKCDETRVIPIPVLNYSESHEIIGKSKIESAEYLPYSPNIDIEGKLVDSTEECKDSILRVKINNLFEIPRSYIKAVENNCLAVVFFTDKRSKFVIKSDPLLNLFPTAPPKIPGIIIPKSEEDRIESKLSIKANVSIRESAGYILECIKNSKYEKKIYITAHHDHWFKGEHDNLLSVSMLPELNSEKYELHLVSFTAEEAGALGYQSFSWSYGSRKYFEVQNKNMDILLNINLDNIDPCNLKIKAISSMPSIFEKYFNNIHYEPEIYSDGYTFIKNGIPSITFEGYYKGYHSTNDEVNPAEEECITNLLLTFNKILNDNTLEEIRYEKLRNEIMQNMSSIQAPLRTYLVNILDKLNDREIYETMLKLHGGILSMDGLATVKPFHKLVGIRYGKPVYIEGKPSLKISSTDKLYLSSIAKEFENEYMSKIYEVSKKFF
ncbi:M28 family peptidase [Acidianus sp. HS-5]|uniref:M28 family peptidase n=1 Tax=Acidianus sp. HS-5 TaxID=2886040 RepID=UPI001F418FFD|nr:M28 family peptidase [Acidianus sp. HS-5]BDC19324.1 Zn-dependent exopeptidase M28 [Acidianus sp. HS-5]